MTTTNQPAESFNFTLDSVVELARGIERAECVKIVTVWGLENPQFATMGVAEELVRRLEERVK